MDKLIFDFKNIILPFQLLASPARPSGSPQPQSKHIVEKTLLRFSKVFVTHGGLGSLVEAIYHKAVIVGIPLRFHICKENATICIFSATTKSQTFSVQKGMGMQCLWTGMR